MNPAPQVLLTKLQSPHLLASLVRRERLHARLNKSARQQLILVSAPAGFGKTTLIAGWLNEQGAHAWLSLDEDDNDPRRFLLHLLAALQTLEPAIGRSVQVLLNTAPQLPLKTAVTTLINDIAALDQPVLLALDDYHLIEGWPVHEALQFLLDHQPKNLQLVIMTREDPPLSLPRLRARQQLLELRATDLRFTLDEALRFFRETMQLDLSRNEVRALEQRTEGWAAGLHLAALSLQQSPNPLAFIRDFSGDDRYVLDYLVDEVLARQTEDVQDFLVKTSVLERFCAPLCDAVVFEGAQARSAELITQLERANLFIVALDNNREWFRYHHLFADLLKHRLALRHPEEVHDLHRRASRWHAEQDYSSTAIKHALIADDTEIAANLVEKQLLSLLGTGTLPELTASLNQLPADIGRARPWLAVAQAWVTVHAGQLSETQAWLQEAERVKGQDNNNLTGHALAVKAYLMAMLGDMASASTVAQQALELLPADALSARVFSLVSLGAAHRFSARLEGSRRGLRAGQAAPKAPARALPAGAARLQPSGNAKD